ncbi:MAG: hypothetical protein NXI17_09810 [Alphaproteobacteria bacterium]|nr:hypothetical protein [Alphaproteobacteria bacterium]
MTPIWKAILFSVEPHSNPSSRTVLFREGFQTAHDLPREDDFRVSATPSSRRAETFFNCSADGVEIPASIKERVVLKPEDEVFLGFESAQSHIFCAKAGLVQKRKIKP